MSFKCAKSPSVAQSLDYCAAAAAAKLLQSCPTLCDPIDGTPPGSRPWGSPGKNTGVGCHFLLQCMKVKSESEVAQSYPTLNEDHGIWSHHFMGNRWGNSGNSVRLYFFGLQNHCRW